MTSWYEQMDDLDIDDKFFEDVGVISSNKYVQQSVESLLGLKKRQSEVTTDFKAEKAKVLKTIKNKRHKVETLMQSAPFWRTADKYAFVFGCAIIISYSFIMGRCPHDHCYLYV
jgi:hypothetical protein